MTADGAREFSAEASLFVEIVAEQTHVLAGHTREHQTAAVVGVLAAIEARLGARARGATFTLFRRHRQLERSH